MRQHGRQFCAIDRLANFRNLKIRRFERVIRSGSQMTNPRPIVVKPEVDFNDPDWKKKFQEDFKKRFNLPHLRDVLDIQPKPTTFSLKSR
ncbi:hypothetical protein BHE74_00016470 [Ensete ventricosum]|nr:hypothetical protein GW17_00034994 [Ensete ventricosum]RWW75502.1 hypothetical protein BHE74_00016470 [Ensete ventricosum]RZR91486.1 hypothetical protein BHM03_00019620 [Ensete ventricosum]